MTGPGIVVVPGETPDAGPKVRPWRTRTRDTEPAPESTTGTPQPGARLASARETALKRWRRPIGEPPPEDPQDGEDTEPALPGAFAHLRINRHTSPSMNAVWADFAEGAWEISAEHPLLLIPYLGFGLPGLAVAAAAKFTFDSSIRPGRFAALLFAVVLLIAGLWIAGAI